MRYDSSKEGESSTMWVMRRISFSFFSSAMVFSSMLSPPVLGRPGGYELLPLGIPQGLGNGKDVLVAAPRLVDDDDGILPHVRRLLKGPGESMGRFQGRD